jgi:hypothetical protein
MIAAVTLSMGAGSVEAQVRVPTGGRTSVDGLALLASEVSGIRGQIGALRSKLDSTRLVERCCTGELAALGTALDVLRADAAKVRQAYRTAGHTEGMRKSGQMHAQLARLVRALDALGAASDVQGARAEATHLWAAADALGQTISDAASCCGIWLSP